jgi:hypothetical protein
MNFRGWLERQERAVEAVAVASPGSRSPGRRIKPTFHEPGVPSHARVTTPAIRPTTYLSPAERFKSERGLKGLTTIQQARREIYDLLKAANKEELVGKRFKITNPGDQVDDPSITHVGTILSARDKNLTVQYDDYPRDYRGKIKKVIPWPRFLNLEPELAALEPVREPLPYAYGKEAQRLTKIA